MLFVKYTLTKTTYDKLSNLRFIVFKLNSIALAFRLDISTYCKRFLNILTVDCLLRRELIFTYVNYPLI